MNLPAETQVETRLQHLRLRIQELRQKQTELEEEMCAVTCSSLGILMPEELRRPHNPEQIQTVGEGYRLLTWAEVLVHRFDWSQHFPGLEFWQAYELAWVKRPTRHMLVNALSTATTYRIPVETNPDSNQNE